MSFDGAATGYEAVVDLAAVNARILELAAAQSRDMRGVSANIFTDPEIATVGNAQRDIDEGRVDAGRHAASLYQPEGQDADAQDGFIKRLRRRPAAWQPAQGPRAAGGGWTSARDRLSP